jgi:hypothetical protein
MCILSTAYLGPVEYYHHLARFSSAKIELWETYSKQSYRNRCRISGPNGLLNLTIPVSASNHTKTKDVKIDNSVKWQINHWRALEASYRSSPFYIYYDYELQPFYEQKFDFLFDFNQSIQNKMLELIQLDVVAEFTSEYVAEYDNDFRTTIHPKKESAFITPPYRQVFQEKFHFFPNLSIVDLLFNKGPEAKDYLLEGN